MIDSILHSTLYIDPFSILPLLTPLDVSSDGCTCTGEVSVQYSNTTVTPSSTVSGGTEQLAGSGGAIDKPTECGVVHTRMTLFTVLIIYYVGIYIHGEEKILLMSCCN